VRVLENEALFSVLKQYGILPQYMEAISKKVHKVYTNKGTYALKKINGSHAQTLISNIQLLSQSRYKSFVPIYQTINQEWLAKKDDDFYYLMPWVENEKRPDMDDFYSQFFHELGNLHFQTKKEWMLDESIYENQFAFMLNRFEKEEQLLEKFLERCEKNWYMSPFELQAAMYMNETIQALQFAKRELNEWYEKIKEAPVARIVLNHGNLKNSHFIVNEDKKPFFINFERSYYATPIQDLIIFYQKRLTCQPFECRQCLEWLMSYQNRFPLTEAERKLFLSYLAYPSAIIKMIYQYEKKSNEYTELEYCQRLLRRYWQMKNIEYVVMRWIEAENHEKAKNNPPSS